MPTIVRKTLGTLPTLVDPDYVVIIRNLKRAVHGTCRAACPLSSVSAAEFHILPGKSLSNEERTMHEKSVELLNKAISDELSAVHQYMYFHFHCDDQGYDLLAALFKKTAIE